MLVTRMCAKQHNKKYNHKQKVEKKQETAPPRLWISPRNSENRKAPSKKLHKQKRQNQEKLLSPGPRFPRQMQKQKQLQKNLHEPVNSPHVSLPLSDNPIWVYPRCATWCSTHGVAPLFWSFRGIMPESRYALPEGCRTSTSPLSLLNDQWCCK